MNYGTGKIIPNGVALEKHEYATILLLTSKGYDVELIPKSNKEGHHTPDIQMDDLRWEMKSPTGETKNTIKNNIQNALLQSVNVILDLRRIKRPMENACMRLTGSFRKIRRSGG